MHAQIYLTAAEKGAARRSMKSQSPSSLRYDVVTTISSSTALRESHLTAFVFLSMSCPEDILSALCCFDHIPLPCFSFVVGLCFTLSE